MKFLLSIFVAFFFVVASAGLAYSQDVPPSEEQSPPPPSTNEPTDEIQTFGPGSEEEQPQLPPEEGEFKKEQGQGEQKTEVPPAQQGTIEGAAPNEYIIIAGDNLWDICSRFLGNPFEWPRLWSINDYITNPHYIYPGGRLVFKPGTEVSPPKMEIAGTAPATTEAAKPAEESLPDVEEAPAPKPVVAERKVDYDRSLDEGYVIKLRNISFISPKELSEAGEITHSTESKKMLSTGDKVYLRFKKVKDVAIGDKYSVFDTVQLIKHPKSGKKLGFEIMEKATVKVFAIDKNVITAYVSDCLDSVSRGDKLIPFKNHVRKVVPKEMDKEVNGYIVGSEPKHRLIGQREITYIDKGMKQGVEDGTIFYVVRRGDGLISSNDSKLPLTIVGKIVVVEAKESTATAYVIDSNKDLEIGDSIKTKL
jgi:hypothetical protein